MKFGPVPLKDALGKILGHNVTGQDGHKVLGKGKRLDGEDLAFLEKRGQKTVYVAELGPDDVDEDRAAERIAAAVMGGGLIPSRPYAGRVNLLAEMQGVLRVDPERLNKINQIDGITLATLASFRVVQPKKLVASIKVIPFGLPKQSVDQVNALTTEGGPLIKLTPLKSRAVSIILSGSPYAQERVVKNFEAPLRKRLESLGARIQWMDYIPLEDELGQRELTKTIRQRAQAGAELIILAGETAIMDRHDITPRAVEQAGGEVTCFGAPVDPGNLMLLAYLGEVPVLGAPGCARSKKANVIDRILPPLLAGEPLSRSDIVAWGHGGLMEEVPERPMPRLSLPT